MRRRFGRCLEGRPWLQVLLLLGFWFLCERGGQALRIPLPGSIVSLLLLLALLLGGILPLGAVRRGASGFLDHMLLFFVPAFMALMNHPELLGSLGLRLLVVVVAGTLSVMVGTGLIVELCFRWRQGHAS
nr:CidA/LrgA family protein [uncultured Holophaga sp.]